MASVARQSRRADILAQAVLLGLIRSAPAMVNGRYFRVSTRIAPSQRVFRSSRSQRTGLLSP